MIVRFPGPVQRGGVAVPRAAWRIGASLIRRSVPRLSVAVVDLHLGGRMQADLRTPFGLSLYRYGIRDPAARLMPALLRPGDVVIDGGANFGLFSLIAATAVGSTGRVIACEPVAGTAAQLRTNMRLSGISTIELREVALSDVSGAATIVVFDGDTALASFAPDGEGDGTIDVEMTTLDEVSGACVESVALVKLDIEGAEVKALHGSTRLLRHSTPMLLVEVERGHLARQETSPENLRDLLEGHGYEGFAITASARLKRLTGPWEPPDAANPNLLLVPPSRWDRIASVIDA